jgi:hypothetical protein
VATATTAGRASRQWRSDDGQPAATLGQPPFGSRSRPGRAASCESFTVTAQAADLAGNVSNPVSRTVTVVSEGVVVGQVLADETSLPLAGATVRLLGARRAVTADARAATLPCSQPRRW